eukprot:scaffold141802_cov33-Tisochrysis_lutea.AAC.2
MPNPEQGWVPGEGLEGNLRLQRMMAPLGLSASGRQNAFPARGPHLPARYESCLSRTARTR